MPSIGNEHLSPDAARHSLVVRGFSIASGAGVQQLFKTDRRAFCIEQITLMGQAALHNSTAALEFGIGPLESTAVPDPDGIGTLAVTAALINGATINATIASTLTSKRAGYRGGAMIPPDTGVFLTVATGLGGNPSTVDFVVHYYCLDSVKG